jgi:uncharacterized protein
LKINKISIAILLLLAIIVFLYSETNTLTVTKIELPFDNLPENFDGFKIVHISDLHNKEFGTEQQKLVEIIKKSKPDMIAITGDLIDSDYEKDENAVTLVKEIRDIAPIYYVTGNHEWRSGRYPDLREELEKLGVKILDDKVERITVGQDDITILGIDDPFKYRSWDRNQYFRQELGSLVESVDKDDFTILLSHRPELFEDYVSHKIPLVLSGHTHGGQIGLPGKRAIIAPHQGLFPKYSKGLYEKDNTKMVISRGLGTSKLPIRLFNRPQVIVISLSRLRDS